MKISAFIILPFLTPAVLSAPLANIGLGTHISNRSPQVTDQPKTLEPATDVGALELGIMKKLFLEIPMIEILDPRVRKTLEDMPDAVFEKLTTVPSDKFLAFLDQLLAGKMPERRATSLVPAVEA
ncbi:hypothetical protein TWF718_006833 [Orbilia javanica]|uniref:Uncharacterized protein n=1 Tax=Orbilia javanica TaxID=47235 RepID=A0AAN8N5Y3_9PEZI